MKIIDAHCDVLSKMLLQPDIDFRSDKRLDVTLNRLKAARMVMQSFAIYMPTQIVNPRFEHVLESIDLFHTKIMAYDEMLFVRTKQDLREVWNGNKIGALLTLEGVGPVEGNFTYLRILYYLGIRSIGITWNYANWAADGVLEPRQGGFSRLGKQLVKECNRLGIILDVSHLTENGFWELVEMSDKPFIASHSNVYELCPHVRNLRKDQIEAILQMDGRIGIVFYPNFIDASGTATIPQIINHIEFICSMGGVKHIGFGSDFDGIDSKVKNLDNPAQYYALVNELDKHYKRSEVQGFLSENWYRFYEQQLP